MKINSNFNQNSNANSTPNPKAPICDAQGNRLYHFLGIFVSSDGKTIYKQDPITNSITYYQIFLTPNKNPYIMDNGKVFYVDYLVARCFKYLPHDAQKYKVFHLDGKPENCEAKNLEWRLLQPNPLQQSGPNPSLQHSTQNQFSNSNPLPTPNMSPVLQQQNRAYLLNTYQECKFGPLTLNKKGEVYDGKNVLTMCDVIFDGDTNLSVCIRPYVVSANGKRYYLEELVRRARYVEGTPDGMTSPKILHKDHDRNNFASSNLEWVEENSPEYQAYMQDEKAYIRKRNVALNPGIVFPEFMQPK